MMVAAVRLIWPNAASALSVTEQHVGVVMYALLGGAAGVVSGMGIGGGTVLIPALVILAGFSQQNAQAVNLITFIPTAAVAVTVHLKNDNVEKKAAVRLTLFGLAAAAAGAFLALRMSGDWLKSIFGGFLLLMGLFEFFRKER